MHEKSHTAIPDSPFQPLPEFRVRTPRACMVSDRGEGDVSVHRWLTFEHLDPDNRIVRAEEYKRTLINVLIE